MSEVELVELRTANSRTVELPDGELKTTIQEGMHYHDRDTDQWEPCDNSIHQDQQGDGWTCNCPTGQARARFGFGGRVRVGFMPGVYVTYEPVGADPDVWARHPEPHIALYPDLWPGADLRYTKFPEGIKTDVLIADPSAARSYSFALAECVHVTPHLTDDGLEYHCAEDDSVVSVVAPPTVVDANDEHGPAALDYVDGVLTLSVDADWLADSERAFPVVLDPTTVIQPNNTAGLDTYVDQTTPTTNYGTATSILGGDQSSANQAYRSLLAFPLSAIPSGQVITAATLKLTKPSTGVNNVPLSLFPITQAWDKAAVNWNNQPSHDTSTILATTTVTAAAGTFSWTGLATIVQEWYSGARPNYGAMLRRNPDGIGGAVWTVLRSSRHTVAAERPTLEVTYRLPAIVTPASPTGPQSNPAVVINSLAPRLSWSYSSPDGGPQQRLHVQVYDANEVKLWDSGEVTSSLHYRDVPGSANLQYGKLLFWRVRVYDGSWGPWSDRAYFRCMPGAPSGLTATPWPLTASIRLNWTASTAPQIAGYRVYRKENNDWRRVSGLVTGTTFTDQSTASGIEYEYAVTAVALNGHQSDQSAAKTGSVTFDGYWLDDRQIKLIESPRRERPRLGSKRTTLTGRYATQDWGYAPPVLTLPILCSSRVEVDAVYDMFPAGHVAYYRDEEGHAIRGQMLDSPIEARIENTAKGIYFTVLTITLTEVEL